MSDANESNGRAHLPDDAESVLAKLPRTRPQRATPRRAAARRAAAADGPASAAVDRTGAAKRPAGAAKAQGGGRKPTRTASEGPAGKAKAGRPARARPAAAKARRRPKASSARLSPAPPQGFECEWDRASGPVRPPGGADLAASAVEVLGELAKAGLAGGERLVKDVLGRLPVP